MVRNFIYTLGYRHRYDWTPSINVASVVDSMTTASPLITSASTHSTGATKFSLEEVMSQIENQSQTSATSIVAGPTEIINQMVMNHMRMLQHSPTSSVVRLPVSLTRHLPDRVSQLALIDEILVKLSIIENMLFMNILEDNLPYIARHNYVSRQMQKRVSQDPRLYNDSPFSERRFNKLLSRTRRGAGLSKLFGGPLVTSEVDVSSSVGDTTSNFSTSSTEGNNMTHTEVGPNGTITNTKEGPVSAQNIHDSVVTVNRGNGAVGGTSTSSIKYLQALAEALAPRTTTTTTTTTTMVPRPYISRSLNRKSRYRDPHNRFNSHAGPKSGISYGYDTDYDVQSDPYYYGPLKRTQNNHFHNIRGGSPAKLSAYEEEQLFNRIYQRIISILAPYFQESEKLVRQRRAINLDTFDWSALARLNLSAIGQTSHVSVSNEKGAYEIFHFPDPNSEYEPSINVSYIDGALSIETNHSGSNGTTFIYHKNLTNTTNTTATTPTNAPKIDLEPSAVVDIAVNNFDEIKNINPDTKDISFQLEISHFILILVFTLLVLGAILVVRFCRICRPCPNPCTRKAAGANPTSHSDSLLKEI